MVTSRPDIVEMLGHRRPGFALERPFYMDQDVFRLDMELLWYREWLFVGHDCELPDVGSFLTLQVGAYPIIIVRGQDDAIRALHNSCRHRGSRVCKAEKGTSASLVCPHHQWTYELNGQLSSARQMEVELDKRKYSLAEIAIQVLEGVIFICLADRPRDFEPVREHLLPYLKSHRLINAKVAHETTIIEKGNWKLVWENNRECYHCAANHPELCRSFPESPTETKSAGGADDPEVIDLWTKCEAMGLASRFKVDSTGQYRTTRAPLIRGATSYTMDGRPAVTCPLLDAGSIENIGALLLYHYPSTWNHYLADHAVTFRVLPLSATETLVTTKWLVHRDAVEGVDYEKERLTHVWTETNNQDRRVVEDNAAGISSLAYEPGPYSKLYEGGVMQFVDWYVTSLKSALGEKSPLLLNDVA